MSNKKNESKSLISRNSINNNNSHSKTFINPEMSKIHQDLVFFKNDILLDIRKVEERFNVKLTEQSIINSEQYDSFEKKLTELSERINKVQSLILDSTELAEKIKAFIRFKTKAEDNFNRLSARIMQLQKENSDYVNNIEKMISENLRYPGVIGRNAKFLNFRFFIDYTIRSFNDLQIWNASNGKQFNNMFYHCTSLLDSNGFENWNMSNAVSLTAMFSACSILTEAKSLVNWDVSNCKNFMSMFSKRSLLLSLRHFKKWNDSNGINFSYMFFGANRLDNIMHLSEWNVSNGTDFSFMFYGCKKLVNLFTIEEWNVSKGTYFFAMFGKCDKSSVMEGINDWKISKELLESITKDN